MTFFVCFLGGRSLRQVTQAAQQGSVGDYMVSAVYLQQEEGLISVR